MTDPLQDSVLKMVEDYLNCSLFPASTSERLTPNGDVEYFMVLSSNEVDVEVRFLVKEKW